MRGDHTLFTTAEGIESLWERSQPLLDDPPPVKPYPPGTWGPNAIHQLIAPNAWRLPFERAWREKIALRRTHPAHPRVRRRVEGPRQQVARVLGEVVAERGRDGRAPDRVRQAAVGAHR